MQPLKGLTVVTLEHAIAAPFCTRQLADLGARVIKVERPGVGDFARAHPDAVHPVVASIVTGRAGSAPRLPPIGRLIRPAEVAALVASGKRRPKVFFEEWDEPHISGIRWVSELLGIAGGDDVFPELAVQSLGKHRIIADGAEIVARSPDIVIGSWCGKKFRPEKVAARAGWQDVAAVKNGQLFEIKSADILQPGPAALTDGLARLHAIICGWHERHPA